LKSKTRHRPASAEHMRLEIIAANLRYGDAAAPLRVRAYAQVVAKVLLAEEPGTPLKLEKIRQRCRELLVTATPTRESVQTALEFLIAQRQVDEIEGGRYRMRAGAWKELSAQVTVQSHQVDHAITRHFPLDVDADLLRKWFDLTGVRLFTTYGDRWVAATARGRKPDVSSANVEAVAIGAARELGLADEAGLLAEQFRDFIRSDNPEDNMLLWHFGRAMFAARLMAADLAADPISVHELAGSILVIDTNVLLALAVEPPDMMPALDGLARALSTLDVRLVYSPQSLEEYERIVDVWRGETLSHFDRYGYGVLREAADDHVQAAIRHACASEEHFETFYDQLSQVPTALGSLPIGSLADADLEAAAEAGAADSTLIQEIRGAWSAQRSGQKRLAAARHDAAVTALGRAARACGHRCWIVTNDRTMQRLAASWAGGSDAPLWLTLDTLLQVLAVEQEGSDMDATVFAPLLAQLISNDVQACRYQYELSDIQTLEEIITGAEDLPPQDVQTIARRIHARRMAGASRTDFELKLEINRVYQKVRNRIGRDLQEAQQNERQARRLAYELEERNRQLEADARERRISDRARELNTQLCVAARGRKWREVLIWSVCVYGVAGAALGLWYWAAPGTAANDAIGLAATLCTPLLAVVAALWRSIVPRYRAAIAEAPARARVIAETEEVPGNALTRPHNV
jgi:hypothetical protein